MSDSESDKLPVWLGRANEEELKEKLSELMAQYEFNMPSENITHINYSRDAYKKFLTMDRMIKFFAFSHLPEHLQKVSKPFHELALLINETIAAGPERTVALRKLLEAKDAAVRAKIHPGV